MNIKKILIIAIILFSMTSCQRFYILFKGVSQKEKATIDYFIKNIESLGKGDYDTSKATFSFNKIWNHQIRTPIVEEMYNYLNKNFKCNYTIIKNDPDISDYINEKKEFYSIYRNFINIEDKCSQKKVYFVLEFNDKSEEWQLASISYISIIDVEFVPPLEPR